jgi:hypothetical protein
MIVAALGFAPQPAGAAERTARPAGMLPPHEIITIVRSAGLKPVGKPTLKGSTYMLSAIDDEGSKMRVVVDGRVGELISVTPVVSGREFSPMPPSVYDSGSPVYGAAPPVSRGGVPVIIEDESEPPVFRRAPPVPVAVPNAPPQRELRERELPERDAVIVPPAMVPPPSPPEIITAPLAPPSTAMVAPPEGEDGELLPPPPPRFPQRVNATPAAKPKPAKSAASKPAAKTEKPPTPAN